MDEPARTDLPISDQSGLAGLWLLHLSDSALPIGSMAHSFGLETLVESGLLEVGRLREFLADYLEESGILEGSFCAAGHGLSLAANAPFDEKWASLNNRLSAFRPARESRTASATLGRRFLSLAAEMTGLSAFGEALSLAHTRGIEIHHCIAFGFVGGVLGINQNATVSAFLHQSVASMVSSCQRLLPLGQVMASRILWSLKPEILRSSALCMEAASFPEDQASFTPSIDMGAMRHPALRTRLFIS